MAAKLVALALLADACRAATIGEPLAVIQATGADSAPFDMESAGMIAISAESDNMAKVCFSGPWAIWGTTIRRTTAASNTPGNTVGSNFPDAPLVSNIETAEQGYTSTSLIQFGSAPGGNWRLERMGQGGRDASATSNFLTMNRGTVCTVTTDFKGNCNVLQVTSSSRQPLISSNYNQFDGPVSTVMSVGVAVAMTGTNAGIVFYKTTDGKGMVRKMYYQGSPQNRYAWHDAVELAAAVHYPTIASDRDAGLPFNFGATVACYQDASDNGVKCQPVNFAGTITAGFTVGTAIVVNAGVAGTHLASTVISSHSDMPAPYGIICYQADGATGRCAVINIDTSNGAVSESMHVQFSSTAPTKITVDYLITIDGPQVLVGYLDADGAYKVAKGTLSSSGSLSFAAAYTVVASGSVGDSVSLTAWVHHACCQAAEILARPTNVAYIVAYKTPSNTPSVVAVIDGTPRTEWPALSPPPPPAPSPPPPYETPDLPSPPTSPSAPPPGPSPPPPPPPPPPAPKPPPPDPSPPPPGSATVADSLCPPPPPTPFSPPPSPSTPPTPFSPPPSPSTPPPPQAQIVSFILTASGSVADYDEAKQSAMKTDLASAAGVTADQVALTITAGSVNIAVAILAADPVAATSITTSLAAPLADAASATALFTTAPVAVATVTTPVATDAPDALVAPAADGGLGGGALAGIVIAVLVVVGVGGFLVHRSKRSKVEADAKGGVASA